MNVQKKNFRQQLLLSASILTMASVNGGALAQIAGDADSDDNVADAEVQQIVVTGYRRSLESAQNLKEDGDTFLDAITAEDIGALPDRSVAEALQRVPGVNIGRFKKTSDPDRFSVEGADVVIRGLPFVRSELNGREVFSATGGRVLSFNDISPELLGAVKVFKNTTADMTDGGISGTVDLETRKPISRPGLRIAGTVEANYGDLAKEWSPGFSLLGSNTWESSAGTFGLQLGYAQSELITRSDASQVTDPCYRELATLDSTGCIRVNSVTDGGVGDSTGFDETNFPPAGSVVVPKGAGVRTTGYDRDRNAFSAVAQFESENKELLITAEYLRAEADLRVDEHAILALVNDDGLFPSPAAGSTWDFDSNGVFQSGVLSEQAWHGFNNCQIGSLDAHAVGAPEGEVPNLSNPCDIRDGIPTEFLRFQREDRAKTEDFSVDIQWSPSDRIDLNFEAQHVKSDRTEDGVITNMIGRSDIFLDLSGGTPDVQFLAPVGEDSTSHFSNADRFYNWFIIDSLIDNEAEMTSFKADVDYSLNEDGIFKRVKFGARWAERDRVTRDNDFGNWGNLSNAWTWTDGPKNPVYASNAASQGASNLRSPFASFQRGNATIPVPGGTGFFFGGDDLISDYFDGTVEQQADAINQAFGATIAETWGPVSAREGLVEGTVFLPSEISEVEETTKALYARVDFGFDDAFGDGLSIDGNIGVRYVKTTIQSGGQIQFPLAENAPNIDEACNPSVPLPPGAGLPSVCSLSPARQAEFLAAFTGELIDDDADINFEHWLPSFNVRARLSPDIILRGAVSKGISRPDLADFSTGGTIGSRTDDLLAGGTLETGTLFGLGTGNRLLRPVKAWSYDLSAEWYFDSVGSLTVSAFLKDIDGLITFGPTLRSFTSESGVTTEVEIIGPANDNSATVKGIEIAYQQTFDFLPGILRNLGMQATYTYVDGGNLENATDDDAAQPFTSGLPFVGISKDTINVTGFYEDEKLSVRLAYNWRSKFLLTPRDDIFPFSPIFGESTGQLDGSIFYNVTDFVKVGVQGVNLLDEVVQTTQLIDFDGTTLPRTAFRNDRRFTFLARFEF